MPGLAVASLDPERQADFGAQADLCNLARPLPRAVWIAVRIDSRIAVRIAVCVAVCIAVCVAVCVAIAVAISIAIMRSLFFAWLAALGLCPALLFAQVGEEVPFITTPDRVTLAMLQLAGVRSSDHVLDLGSGDGRIVITAARRFGASALGVEIVPELVQRSRDAARQAGVEGRAQFREQDLFKTDLSAATVITMYLLPEVNLQLRPALLQLAPGTRIVSHDWDMGDWLPDETLTMAAPDKKVGREKISRLHRWVVPVRAEGLWCGPGGAQLRLTQRFQAVQAQWRLGPRERMLHGVLDGRRLSLLGATMRKPLQGRVEDTQMQLQTPALAPSREGAAGRPGLIRLTRSAAASCGA